jgi:hypothetical protein
MENATPHSLIRNKIGEVNRSAVFGTAGNIKGAVPSFMTERKLLKGLEQAVKSNATKLPKMKGMSWPLIESKVIDSNPNVQAEAYRLFEEGKTYQAILSLFPNLQA